MKTLLKVALAVYVPVSLVALRFMWYDTKILFGIVNDPEHRDDPEWRTKLAESAFRGNEDFTSIIKRKFSTKE